MQKSTLRSLISTILYYYGDHDNRPRLDSLPFSHQSLEIVDNADFVQATPDLFSTISAFSNQDGGGILVFGLRQSEVKHSHPFFYPDGVNDPDVLMRDIDAQCAQMEPVVKPLLTSCVVNGRVYIAAEIPGAHFSKRPVYYSGAGCSAGGFVRDGKKNNPISEHEIYCYMTGQYTREDTRFVERTSIEQLDSDVLMKYAVAILAAYPNLSGKSDREIVEFMGLCGADMSRGTSGLSLAAVMCLTRVPQAVFPLLCVEFSDGYRAEGTIARMVDEATAHILQQEYTKELPEAAVRQALLNALIHRDYSVHTENTPVRVTVSVTKVTIENPISVTRRSNTCLAALMEHLGVAENKGSGIETIKQELSNAGLVEPKFKSSRNMYTVVLDNSVYKELVIERVEIPAPNALLEFCTQPRTRAEIIAFTGKSYGHVSNYILKPLVEKGILTLTAPEHPRSRHQMYVTTGAANG